MFEPPDFIPPLAQIPPLYTTQEDYCAVAVPFSETTDNTFNYKFEEMIQNDEKYKVLATNAPPKSETGVGFESLDAYCAFFFEQNALALILQTNYSNTVLIPNACNTLNQNHTIFLDKIKNIISEEFQNKLALNNILTFVNETKQNRITGEKEQEINIRFTDQQLCKVNNTWRRQLDGSVEIESQICMCPDLQTPTVDEQIMAPTDLPLVTEPVTEEPIKQL